jgi:hypothetical protein
MTAVVKSTHPSFPEEGVDVHVSVAEAVRHGIKPGDPAVVEVIVRPYTAADWVAEGEGRVFETDEEEDAFFDRAPSPGE